MSINFTDPSPKRLRELPEKASAGAKVPASAVPKAESRMAERRLIGGALLRVRELAGLSLKEFAALVQRDERQVARWLDGSEPAQLGAVLAVVRLRPLIVQAFAEVAGEGVDVLTSITIRRRA